jgi:hypothetical protein
MVGRLVGVEDAGLGGEEALDARFGEAVAVAEVDIGDQVVAIEGGTAKQAQVRRRLMLGGRAESRVAGRSEGRWGADEQRRKRQRADKAPSRTCRQPRLYPRLQKTNS